MRAHSPCGLANTKPLSRVLICRALSCIPFAVSRCRYGSFALFNNEAKYCSTLQACQVITMGTLGLGMVSLAISVLLVAGQFKTEKKTSIIIGNTILQLLLTFGSIISFTLWLFVHMWFNRDLNGYFPGASPVRSIADACTVQIVLLMAFCCCGLGGGRRDPAPGPCVPMHGRRRGAHDGGVRDHAHAMEDPDAAAATQVPLPRGREVG